MRATITLIFAVWASLTHAQSGGLFSLQSTQDGRAWEAVGRLEIGGAAFCTGALIDENIVLTAAHCLYDAQTGQRVPVDDIQFLAGWRNGRAAAYRRIRRAVPHPDYSFSGPATSARVRNDIALIELQHPIRNTTIQPFDVGSKPERGDRVGVVSYAHNRSEAPSLQDTCTMIAPQNGMLVLDCQVDFGSSGSPVFELGGERPKIISVVSAKAEANGMPVSLAMELASPLAVVRAAFAKADNSGAGLEPMQAGARRETGAKFVSP